MGSKYVYIVIYFCLVSCISSIDLNNLLHINEGNANAVIIGRCSEMPVIEHVTAPMHRQPFLSLGFKECGTRNYCNNTVHSQWIDTNSKILTI